MESSRETTAEHATWQDEMSLAHNIAEVIIGKKHYGPLGTVKLYFDMQFTKLRNLARDTRTLASVKTYTGISAGVYDRLAFTLAAPSFDTLRAVDYGAAIDR